MEFLLNTLVVLHFIGLASLLGGFLTQMKSLKSGTAKIVAAMRHGAWTMLATGLLLVGVHEMSSDEPLNHVKIAVKSIVLTVILVLVLMNRKKESVKTPIFGAIGALTITNIVLAVFW